MFVFVFVQGTRHAKYWAKTIVDAYLKNQWGRVG